MRKGISVTIEPKEAYDELIRRSRELATLASCSAVLGWDEQTYMPAGGAAHRGNQMALLAGLHHERATDPRIGELLAIVEGSALVGRAGLGRGGERPRAAAELRPPGPAAAGPGRGAGADDLDGTVGVGRRAGRERLRPLPALAGEDHPAQAGGIRLPGRPGPTDGAAGAAGSAYDPLLDEYEPGARSADLAVLFDALRRELTPLVAAIAEAAARKTRPAEASAPTHRPPRARRSSSDPIRAIGSGSSARRWPRRWASTSGAGGWT